MAAYYGTGGTRECSAGRLESAGKAAPLGKGKGFVEMDISAGDRRKMDVRCTAAGRRCFEQKYDFLLRCLDKYVDVLGEEDILALTRLLQKAADGAPGPGEGCAPGPGEDAPR